MKNIILIAVIVGGVAGAGSSLLTRALSPSSSDGSAAAASADQGLAPGDEGGLEGLGEQLAALKRQNDELTMRLAALEKGASGSSREAVAGETSEDYAQLQQDIADLAAALKDPQSAQSAGLRKSVRTAMEQIEEEQNLERQQERESRDLARVEERMEDLQAKLGLDQVQKVAMREALLTETSKRNAMFTEMRSGNMDRGAIRTAMTELRDETQAALGNILTPMQLEDYQEIESENRWGGRGGRGGGGGGGGGRGGGATQAD